MTPSGHDRQPAPMTLANRIRMIVGSIHRIIGAPDYDRYCAHAMAAHPDAVPMSREEFYRHRLEDRYSRPGARCC